MYLPLIILLVVIVYVVTYFNSLQTLKIQIQAAIQEIGNQLKRQVDLIPNLIESAKAYLKHEKDIFKELTSARKLIDNADLKNPQSVEKAQKSINSVLKSLNIVVESNPEIKGSTVVMDLMNELRDTADKIMYSRRTVIDLTADYNVKLTTIPGIWLAPMFGFTAEKGFTTPKSEDMLSVSSAEIQPPKVKLE